MNRQRKLPGLAPRTRQLTLPVRQVLLMRGVPHVAVLIETSRAYGRGLLEGVTRYNRQHGPWSLYFEPHGLDDLPPPWLSGWKGDGILARIDNRRLAKAVLATRLPAVDLRGRLRGLGLPFIGVHNEAVGRLAFEHFADRGLRHFAFCGLAPGTYYYMDLRREFFRRQVEAAGYVCHVFEPEASGRRPTWEEEQDQLVAWLGRLPRPVGVMTCNDDRGHQVLDACRRAEVAVPEEVALVGVDNDTILCNMADPPMSSIDVNAERIGYEATGLLDELMHRRRARREAVSLEVAPRGIVTRQSSDVLAVGDPEVAAAVRFIRVHAGQGIGVGDVLRHVALSRSALERRFKIALKRTPKEEILRVQLDRARHLLSDSDLSLESIAGRCGFSSSKYFGDAFRRETGLRPGAYRKEFRHFASDGT
jgi:LacI family transcriptional regulator